MISGPVEACAALMSTDKRDGLIKLLLEARYEVKTCSEKTLVLDPALSRGDGHTLDALVGGGDHVKFS